MPQACYAEKSAQVTAQDLNNIFCSLSWAPLAVQGIPNISIDESNAALWKNEYKANTECLVEYRTLMIWLNQSFVYVIYFYLCGKFWSMACQLDKVTFLTLF